MTDAARQLRLGLEAPDGLGVIRQGAHRLERHHFVENGIEGCVCFAHAAARDEAYARHASSYVHGQRRRQAGKPVSLWTETLPTRGQQALLEAVRDGQHRLPDFEVKLSPPTPKRRLN